MIRKAVDTCEALDKTKDVYQALPISSHVTISAIRSSRLKKWRRLKSIKYYITYIPKYWHNLLSYLDNRL